jgi:hypothetical protein
VTRDRIMVDLDREHPAYDFKTHKGYITDVHSAALVEHGPCPQHRMRFVNVRRAAGLEVDPADPSVELGETTDETDEAADETPPEDRVPSVAELVETVSVGSGSPGERLGERGESA